MGIFRQLCLCVILAITSLSVHALRHDVLVIVNDNSVDSPQLGAYYAEQRDIDPANIVHVRVPDSYFISWDDFRRLRDQLIRFMQANTLDDPALEPVVCTDGEPPYYCQAAMEQLRAHTRIRHLVTTRGVPTRMRVAGSTLASPGAPTSVDNYLKYWLINYFADDVPLRFSEREVAFGDGRGMRPVQPATDRELIVGRIDGLDLAAARALVDRTLAAERAGIYGTWYGSSKFFRWRDDTGAAIYPRAGDSLLGWRYALGLWDEDRPECVDYLNVSGRLAEGKAPAYCQVQFNDDRNSAIQTTERVSYPAPGNAASRQPNPVDALVYQGWLDGQQALGGFDALLNWRKDDQCMVTLCADAVDPAACRAASTDSLRELNTDCVGVADGFVGYNHSSYPLSYLAVWPTGWNTTGGGDVDQLAFPEVRTDSGFDDSFSLWFRNTDQVEEPRCYASSDFTLAPDQPCVDARRVVLSQTVPLTPRILDVNNPPTYRVKFRYRYNDLTEPLTLNLRFSVQETGAGNVQIDYGIREVAIINRTRTNRWRSADVEFRLDPVLHTVTSYDGIKISIETAGAFSGDLGIDAVSLQEIDEEVELAINGSFADGHRQAVSGDHAATFLNRLNGVAFWGSVSHHQSDGCAFCFNGLETLIYFLRGLPLGDAVWFNESNNSGILYGDPLYSPVAVRLNPVNVTDTLSGVVDLYGSAVNGRDPAQMVIRYRVDVCPGSDFFICDQTPLAWQSTGISGQGGVENALLGSLDTTAMDPGNYTLRLTIGSIHLASGRRQVINDYYPVDIGEDQDGDGIADFKDNCMLAANPGQRDTDRDGYGNACDADLDNDGVVDSADFDLFIEVFFTVVPGIEPFTLADHADFNGDGTVSIGDYFLFRSLLGAAPGPSCCGITTP